MPVASPRCYLTPPAVAERLGVDPAKVLGWIRSGQLRATNLGDGALRPRYRISEADLSAFLSTRRAGPEPTISRVRRRRDPNVIQFF